MIKLKNIGMLILLICQIGLYAQKESTSVYENLERLETYKGRLSMSSDPLSNIFKVNGEEVDESTYKWFEESRINFENCCPCILEFYDEANDLVVEGVYCTDCRVGWYKEYYDNGKLKVSGNFIENPTNDWEDIYDRGYCEVKDGKWSFYNRRGKLKYTELWKEGKLIE